MMELVCNIGIHVTLYSVKQTNKQEEEEEEKQQQNQKPQMAFFFKLVKGHYVTQHVFYTEYVACKVNYMLYHVVRNLRYYTIDSNTGCPYTLGITL